MAYRRRGSRQGSWLARLAPVLLLCTLALMPHSAAAKELPPPDPDDVEAAAAALQATMDAWVASDTDALDAVTAADFTWIDSSGVAFDRDGWLAAASGEDFTFTAMEAGEASVMALSPDALIFTFPLDLSGVAQGVSFKAFETDTAVVMRGEDGWLLTFVQGTSRAADEDAYHQAMGERIAETVSAAPPAIGVGATVIDWPEMEGGDMRILVPGDNGWTCFADDPTTPTVDPLCGDDEWVNFLAAAMAGEEPEITGLGIAYMLMGGSTANNEDPSMLEPAEGDDWLIDGPHIMLLLPDGFDAEVFSAEHGSGGPYIMWDGTPYEHLMVPVQAVTNDELDELGDMGEMHDTVHSALSAATAEIAMGATVFAPDADGVLAAVIEGENGWACLPDDPATPGPDPICVDGEWLNFLGALMTGEEPDVTAPGLSYMLQGGWTASNFDPAATQPAEGEDWVVDGPHIMLVLPEGIDEESFSTDHTSGGPYVMWSGTPYAHLMIPVGEVAAMEMDMAE